MEKIEVNFVLEIMGRPPENVTEALQTLSVKIGSEKGVKVKSKEIHPPIQVEGSKDLFTAFVEMSLEIDSLNEYIYLLFSYMPSHVEIIEPERLIIANSDLNEIGNNLIRRLHHYDAIAKQMLSEKDILIKQLYRHAPHLFKKEEAEQVKDKIEDKKKPKKINRQKKDKSK